MSEPTARDREIGAQVIREWGECNCVRCEPPIPVLGDTDLSVACLADRFTVTLATERARLLALTPEEAGRLWEESRKLGLFRAESAWLTSVEADSQAGILRQWHTVHEDTTREVLAAFLAALQARAEGAP